MDALGEQAHRVAEADLGEHTGDQAGRDAPHVVDQLRDAAGDLLQGRGRGRGVRHGRPRGVDAQPQCRKGGAEPVVDVAAQPSPLFVPRRDDLFAAGLQVLVQAQGRHRRSHLVGQGRQDLVVLAVQGGRAVARRDVQAPDDRAVVHQVEGLLEIGRAAGGGQFP